MQDKLFNEAETDVIVIDPVKEQEITATDKFWFTENGKLKINNQNFLVLLEKMGFRKYSQGKGYLLVQVDNKIFGECSKGTIN